jgi:hypothetical protein
MELEEWKINHAGRPAGPTRSGLFYRYRSEKNLTGYNYVTRVRKINIRNNQRKFLLFQYLNLLVEVVVVVVVVETADLANV